MGVARGSVVRGAAPLEGAGVGALADEEGALGDGEEVAAGDLHELGVAPQRRVQGHLWTAGNYRGPCIGLNAKGGVRAGQRWCVSDILVK
jgi:hypothetical protein